MSYTLIIAAVISAAASGSASSRVTQAATTAQMMYTWWCTVMNHASEPMCRQHDLGIAVSKTHDPTEHSKLVQQYRKLAAESGNLSREYSAAKMAFCQLKESSKLKLCSQPTRNVTRPAVMDLGTESMYQWLCKKPNLSAEQQGMCRRYAIIQKLKSANANTSPTRLELYKNLRAEPYHHLTYQTVISEYCDIGENIDTSVCLDTKISREGKVFHAYACGGQKSGGLWCKQQALREQLKMMSGKLTDSEKRKKIAKEIFSLTPSKTERAQLVKERTYSHVKFCALPDKKNYHMCNSASVSGPSYSYDR